MRLYLMRHATTGAGDPADDAAAADPALTADGIAKARAAARGVVQQRIEATALLTSPLLRSVQTAEIVAQELGIAGDRIRRSDALKPGGAPAALMEELLRMEEEEVLCVGHAPHLDDVIAHILGCRSRITALKKAAVACLDIHSGSPPRGVLLWLVAPKVLRRLGK